MEVVYSQRANSIIFLKEKKGYMLLYSYQILFMKAQPESLLFGARVSGGVVEEVVAI